MRKRMLRGSLVLMVFWGLLGPVLAARKIDESPPPLPPTIAILPVQVDSEYPSVVEAVDQAVLEAFESMGMKIIAGEPVERACRALKIDLFQRTSQFPGGRPILVSPRQLKPQVNPMVLDEKVALQIGRYLGTDYAAGLVLHPRTKYTSQIFERRLNGRCTMEVVIVDVKRAEVLFEYPAWGQKSQEFGVAQHNPEKQIIGTIGALMATGILGKGHLTRAIGFAAMIAPMVIKGGDRENYAYLASVEAINQVLGDFYGRFSQANYYQPRYQPRSSR